MPPASASAKQLKTKALAVDAQVSDSIISIHKGNTAVRTELGSKLATAMRRRKLKPGVESATEGLRALREGR